MITVILNVYNGEKFIKKCLDSIINQTYKDLEIIIVNDSSTDKTLSICKKYKDKRIKIITNKKNLGLSLSRNVGIDNAHGEYLYFVDVDDYLEKDAIEYLYNLSIKYNADISTCRCFDRYDYKTKFVNKKEVIEELTPYDMLKRVILIKYREGTTWNKLFKKELFEDIRFENRIVNDVVTTHKLVMKSNKVIYSNQIKYNYYRHDESIISKKRTKYMIDMYNAYKERYSYIDKKYPNMLENKASLALFIASTYYTNDKELLNYLKEDNYYDLYKKVYSNKLLKCDMRLNDKLKIFLFRINPNLLNNITTIYLKLRGKKTLNKED